MHSGTLKEFSGDIEIYIFRDPTRVPRINIPRNRTLTNNRTKAPVDSPDIQIPEGNRNWYNPPFASFFPAVIFIAVAISFRTQSYR